MVHLESVDSRDGGCAEDIRENRMQEKDRKNEKE